MQNIRCEYVCIANLLNWYDSFPQDPSFTFELYYMQWLFLKLNPDWSKEFKELPDDVDTFFKEKGVKVL